VVVTVVAVGMVQVAVNEVINVVTVGNGLMAAARAVPMPRLMLAAIMSRSAAGGISAAHLQLVLLDPILARMVQVAVVQVIDVAVVLDGGVAAAGPVLVSVFPVKCRHDQSPSSSVVPEPASSSAACCADWPVAAAGTRVLPLSLDQPFEVSLAVRW